MKFSRPKPLSYAETVRFHGHDGPFLALGYRLGRHLLEELKPNGIMGLRLTVRVTLEKPYTCILDGLQCATLATYGKRNINSVQSRSGHISVDVQAGRRRLTYRMVSAAWALCINQKDLVKAARRVRRASLDRLWFRSR